MCAEHEHKIAFGGDSCVYRIGTDGPVKKVYNGGPLCTPVPVEKVYQYAYVTNEASLITSQTVKIRGRSLSVSINPVNRVYEENNIGIIEAPFIEGNSLAADPDVSEIRAELLKLSHMISESIGVSGIEITPGNTKLCGDKLIVTDLCASMSSTPFVAHSF